MQHRTQCRGLRPPIFVAGCGTKALRPMAIGAGESVRWITPLQRAGKPALT